MKLTTSKQRYVQPTSKGQVTLPVSIRRQLSISTNTLLGVRVDRGRVVLEPVLGNPTTNERWETVVDFTEFNREGVGISDIQLGLKSWTKSKKRSAN